MHKPGKPSPENVNMMVTIFTSTVLATLGSGLFMLMVTSWLINPTSLERFFISLASTIIYTGIVLVTFYLLVPDSKLAFQKLFNRRK